MPKAISAERLFGSLFVVLFGVSPGVTFADGPVIPDCWVEAPVLDINSSWTGPASGAGGWLLGPFQLALAPWRPDIKTEARISWKVQPAAEGDRVEVRLTFPDPKPYGLPYTVQGFAIDSRNQSLVLDWSHDCQDPGISVFPGQSWSGEVAGPIETGLVTSPSENVRVRVWGSRN
jgi:hypothetical protein